MTQAARPTDGPGSLPARLDVVVLGAGLAGLSCALRLSGPAIAAGLDVAVLEASDGVGGRVRTDVVDGFRCDRGFQLLNPAYPAVRRLVDVPALGLCTFPAGVRVLRGGRSSVLGDPRRIPPRLLPDLARTVATGRLGGPRELTAFARWALTCGYGDVARGLLADDEPWGDAATRHGVTGPLREAVLGPFLAGVLGEGAGASSRRFVELLVRSFVRGRPSVPAWGMQALPVQLAARLPAGWLRLGVRAERLTSGTDGVRVDTTAGTVRARAAVVATDPLTAAALLDLPVPPMHPLTTFWHAAPESPDRTGLLHLDGDGRGPVVNTVVISETAPRYAPSGSSLVATTVLGVDDSTAAESAVLGRLADLYGTSTGSWERVRAHALPHALTAMPAPLTVRRPVDLGAGLLVAGDHRDTASSQGALVSGQRAAVAALARIGAVAVPS